ncbi:DUF6531 domain-containing protein [Kitasatospora sp. NPDC059646]|uniref:DUF6531 domain-containing protein n=1 Tax=Kitasatospora sp. NPDC059646 TaxID=3346893 RepID=UPI00368FCFBF
MKNLYRHAGDNLRKVARNVREVEEKHAKDLEKILKGEGKGGVPHPRPGGGGRPGKGGGSHPKGRGRDQVKSPRTEGRPHGSRTCPGEPVDIATGRMFIDQVDAALPGSLPLEFPRRARPRTSPPGSAASSGSAGNCCRRRARSRRTSADGRSTRPRPAAIGREPGS